MWYKISYLWGIDYHKLPIQLLTGNDYVIVVSVRESQHSYNIDTVLDEQTIDELIGPGKRKQLLILN